MIFYLRNYPKISEINQALSEHKEEFCTQSFSLAKDLLNDPCFDVALVSKFINIEQGNCNIDEISSIIDNTLNNTDRNFKYFIRKTNLDAFYGNEIFCGVINPSFHNSDAGIASKRIAEILGQMSHKCFDSFWNNEENIESYTKISQFNGFNDLTLTQEEYAALKKKGGIHVETAGWNNFIAKLLTLFLPEFTQNKQFSNSKMIRFTKPLNDEWNLGIEFDKTIVNKSKRSRFFEYPPYINIVLINNSYDKKSKKDYMYEQDDPYLISLGIMGNPFFFWPAIPPSAYYVYLSDQYYKGSILPGLSPLAKAGPEGDLIKITYHKSDVESLKKYVYFHTNILCYTANNYLQYIEKVIKDLLK